MTRYLISWSNHLRSLRLIPKEKLANMLVKYPDGILDYCRTNVQLVVVDAVSGNIHGLLRRGRGYRNLKNLFLKAQRLPATRIQLVALRKAA